MNRRRIYRGIPLVFMVLVIMSCPNNMEPFNPTVIDQIKDKDLPVIRILSPDNNDIYSQTVSVTGEVTDDGEELPVLTYLVSDASGLGTKTGDIIVTAGQADSGVVGTFDFSFTTNEYSTDILLSVTATDWNGNVGESGTLRMVYPGSTLSSLSLTPGNKQVSVLWEPVSGADEYTVYYDSSGTAFNEATADFFTLAAAEYDGSTPVVLTAADHGVENGVLCRVKVEASSSGGDEWSSSVLETLPLSPFSLLPKTDCFENKIILDWRPAQDGVTYQVWRSDNGRDGDFELIRGVSITEPEFIDNDVRDGVVYYYRVGTENNTLQLSAPVGAMTTSMRTSGSASSTRVLSDERIVDVAVSGDIAYALREIYQSGTMVVKEIEVVALDISDPSGPEELSRTLWFDTEEGDTINTFDIAVADTTAYVSLYHYNNIECWVKAFDISNPYNIQELPDGHIQCPGVYLYYPRGITVDRDRDILYIALEDYGIACVDISDPQNPDMGNAVSGWPSGYDARNVTFAGNYAYVTVRDEGISVINCTDVANPVYVKTISPGPISYVDLYSAIHADPTAERLVLSGSQDNPDENYYHGGLWVYDISDPADPSELGLVDVGIPLTDVQMEGIYAHCSTDAGGLKVMDISNPADIVKRFDIPVLGDSSNLGLFSSGVILSNNNAGATVITLPEEESPSISDTEIVSQSNGSFVDGEILYIAQRSAGVRAFQIESDGSLTYISQKTCYAGDIVVLGDYAFFSPGDLGGEEIGILDVSDLPGLSGQEVVYTPTESTSRSIDYWGDYLYVAEGDVGVDVLDISDPENSVSLGLIPVQRYADMVVAFRDRLLICDDPYGVLAYNIENPETPEYLGDFYDVSSAERAVYSIDADRDYVFASLDTGTYILPFEEMDQWEPAASGSSDYGSALGWMDFYASDVKGEGDFLYAVISHTGIDIYSIQDPEQPSQVYSSGTGFLSAAPHYSLEVRGNNLYCNNYSRVFSVTVMEE